MGDSEHPPLVCLHSGTDLNSPQGTKVTEQISSASFSMTVSLYLVKSCTLDKESLFPFYLIILFIVRRLKCPRMNYTKHQRHAQSACLFNNFHVFPAQENLSFQNPTTTKRSPLPPFYSTHQTASQPQFPNKL